MAANHTTERDGDDAIASAHANDEEALLLPTEEFDIDDNEAASAPYVARRRGIWDRLRGPQPPRPQSISPLLPSIQKAPIRLLERFAPSTTHKRIYLGICLILWVIVFSLLLRPQYPIRDSTGRDVVNLDCVDTLWRRKNECGIGGIDCRPFSNDTFSFRCPANCAGVQLLNPRAIGPLDVNYRPLVIGDNPYRGDSFICGSAIHAGIISDSTGGCGRITRIGEHTSFPNTNKHGIESIPFDSYFPLAFSLSADSSFHCGSDSRGSLLLVSFFFTAALSILSTSPTIFFPLFALIFAHVSFVSDPPSASYRNASVLPDHMSMFAKRLLPAFFCAVVIYWNIVRRTLSGLKAPLEKTLLWLGGFWFGALSNYTFEWIPISRLNAHDLQQQPGAKVALALILVFLVCVIAQQAYYFWREGRLLPYLALYGLFIFGILVCLTIPGVQLRIHHYILALLLLPGTSMQTRPSLLYQGILLGLFVNGIARWDFDSILQTAAALRGDATLDSAVPPLPSPLIRTEPGVSLIKFSWTQLSGVHGISALVNDVERFRGFFAEDAKQEFGWERDITLSLPEYFRFAYVVDGRTLDYTKAGALYGNGTWAVPET